MGMERLIKDEYARIDVLSSKTLRLDLGLWNGYFGHSGRCYMGSARMEYCINCGKKITEEFIKTLIEKFGLEYPNYYLEKHPELDHKLQVEKDKKENE